MYCSVTVNSRLGGERDVAEVVYDAIAMLRVF